jgi:hypothetical protein
MSTTQLSGNRSIRDADGYTPYSVDTGAGWRAFAATMILIGGTLNIIDGIVSIAQASYFRDVAGRNVTLPVTDNIHTWGWVALVIGTLMLVAGLAILAGSMWARVAGVLVASVNLIFQLAYLAHFPFWSFTMILVDMLVIYGLVVHGGVVDEADLDLSE